MDPPGSRHRAVATNESEEDQDRDHDDDGPDTSDQDRTHELAQQVTSQPDNRAAAMADTIDDTSMRSSLSVAKNHYHEYLNRGGSEITSKESIMSSRVIVQTSSQATNASNSRAATAVAASTAFQSATPIIATVVPSDEHSNSGNDESAAVFTTSNQTQRPSLMNAFRPTSAVAVSVNQQHSLSHLTDIPDEAQSILIQRLVVELAFPSGLARQLVHCVQTQFVRHYWLVDNSGSMLTTDCVRMIQKDILDVGGSNMKHPKKQYELVKCSRWNELQSALMSHIELASILNIPTTFRLLKGSNGMQEFTINESRNDVERAKSILRRSEPDGVTLLSDHIYEIYNHIEEEKEALLQKGQKAVVVIATDAIPSDQYGDASEEAKENFFRALQKLQLLPVWIVIKLCTNDRKAINYYRKLDKKLEIPIECISDYITESKEVRKWNGWLNYSTQIHHCRVMGFHHRVFDLLDERPFTKDDLFDFLKVLFGAEVFDDSIAPNIHSDWNEFLQYFKNHVLNKYDQQFSPSTKKMEDWIDVKGLMSAHGFRGSLRNSFKTSMDSMWS
jgi:hypothetical protein